MRFAAMPGILNLSGWPGDFSKAVWKKEHDGTLSEMDKRGWHARELGGSRSDFAACNRHDDGNHCPTGDEPAGEHTARKVTPGMIVAPLETVRYDT
jgi:hypothetical protein